MTGEAIERVALAIAKSRGHVFLTRETTTDDLHRAFGPQIFVEARAAIEAFQSQKHDPTTGPCPTCGFQIVEKEARPLILDD